MTPIYIHSASDETDLNFSRGAIRAECKPMGLVEKYG